VLTKQQLLLEMLLKPVDFVVVAFGAFSVLYCQVAF
jgi:hypothetical protein